MAPGTIINDKPNFENTAEILVTWFTLTYQTGDILVSCKVYSKVRIDLVYKYRHVYIVLPSCFQVY